MLLRLEELRKKPFSLLLAYPRPEADLLEERIRLLSSLGITHVELHGRKELAPNLRVLGKGYVGVVLAARTADGRRVALKVRRTDADRRDLTHEARMLAMANSVGVGPRLLAHHADLLVMEFIDGPHLPDWLSSRPERQILASVLRELLEKCRRLDEIRLDHGELSRAHSHVIIQPRPGGRFEPRIVDFESASDKRRPSNVTSICQYLFISGLSGLLADILGPVDREALVGALRAYKREMSDHAFSAVLEACGLITYK
ncbi:MAG TPA: serine/threonine protein kinase [Candidatus Bathyarchaeota archaeon]|nr:serine/threonine protein kinase [Candidatus Bathyarchaeota archaeon]HEW89855.1 serine/threonine protein kinase [Candidatus Bathyarchaeota archaeon]